MEKKETKNKKHKTNWPKIIFTILAFYTISYTHVTGHALPSWIYIDYVFVMLFGDPVDSLFGIAIGTMSSWVYIIYVYIKSVLYAYRNPKKK